MAGPDIDAGRIAEAVATVIAEQLAQARSAWAAEAAALRLQDDELLAACRAVGAAVDRLSQDRYTPRETLARRRLEQDARRLRGVMRKRKGGARD
jgi:hypothetical protein